MDKPKADWREDAIEDKVFLNELISPSNDLSSSLVTGAEGEAMKGAPCVKDGGTKVGD